MPAGPMDGSPCSRASGTVYDLGMRVRAHYWAVFLTVAVMVAVSGCGDSADDPVVGHHLHPHVEPPVAVVADQTRRGKLGYRQESHEETK